MPSSSKLHRASKQKRGKYSCNRCDFSSAWELILKSHIETEHDSITEYQNKHSDVDVKINTVEPVFIETSNTEIKKEEITEEDPLTDTSTKN